MCGIAGIWDAHDEQSVPRMLSTLTHRGPDGNGLHRGSHHTLGHVRLSIIDVEGGAQPMADSQGQAHIVFNGEIYNHLDLRKELMECDFRTRSDTEVILHLREGRGRGNPDRLDGMFAYAISEGTQLTLARDPLGIKPLYLGRANGALVFASEMKAVLAASDTVSEFPAGHVYTSSMGLRRYYEVPVGEDEIVEADIACEGVRDRLHAAVRKRMLADVPVGVFLSGGLDSSVIAAIARQYKDPLETFAVGTAESMDLARAREVADGLGTRHYERVYTLEQALEVLPQVIYHLESFDCALVRSAIPNFFLAELASQHVKVALSGEGADELFAGYEYLKALPREDLPQELRAITKALHNTNLQRCYRMSMAHGLEVRVPFLDTRMIAYAFRIATDLKLTKDGTEKWVLRKVAKPLLPRQVVWRPKQKFAIGSGLGDGLAQVAEARISDAEFATACATAPQAKLRSKEELLYYRIFCDQFPAAQLLPLTGRSRSI